MDGVSSSLPMDLYIRGTGKMIWCQGLEGWFEKIVTLREKLAKEKQTEKAIIKIIIVHMWENGRMISVMEWEKKSSKLEKKSM